MPLFPLGWTVSTSSSPGLIDPSIPFASHSQGPASALLGLKTWGSQLDGKGTLDLGDRKREFEAVRWGAGTGGQNPLFLTRSDIFAQYPGLFSPLVLFPISIMLWKCS